MWNNRRSFLLLVYVKQQGKIGFAIPLALPVLEVTLESLRDSLEIWENTFPRIADKMIPKHIRSAANRLRLSQLLTWCIRLIDQLRQSGAFEFVNIDDGKKKISIRLY